MIMSKNDFKVIYNTIKNLSSTNIQILITQVEKGQTNNDDINKLINLYSSKKIVKLMNKINIMMGGTKTIITNTSNELKTNTSNELKTNSGFVQENIRDIIEKLSGDKSNEIQKPNNKTTDLEFIKEDISKIIKKLKVKSNLLKSKEKQLIARENKINIKENLIGLK